MQLAQPSGTDISVIDALRHLQIFRQMTDADLASILDCVRNANYEMGKVLFQTGEPYQKSLYILYRGRVGLWGPQGEKHEVDPGAILGLSNFLDGLPFVFTAIALTPISVLVVKETEPEELERSCPALNRLLKRAVAAQIRGKQATRQSYTGSMTRPAKTAMKFPLATCGPEVSLAEAYRIMDERKIGSLVLIGLNEELLGVLTFASLSEAVLVRGASPDDNVMAAGRDTAYTVSSDTPLWEVEEIQHRNSLKYVIVTEDKRPVGMISQTDILHNLLAQRAGIRDEVRGIKNISALTELGKRLLPIASEARDRNHYASTSVRVISEFHIAVQRRCIELTLQIMANSGAGKPTLNFAVLINGSGGRREMMLHPVQRHGLIVGGPNEPVSDKSLQWFELFQKHLIQHLEEIGYQSIDEEDPAHVPMIIMTFAEWQAQIRQMTTAPVKEAAKWFRLVFDCDTLYGDKALTEALRSQVLMEFEDKSYLLKMMASENAEWRPPLGFFNQLIPLGFFNVHGGAKAKGKIDIKCNGLNILGDIVRIYALKAGVHNRNTLERLMGLVRRGELSSEYANSVRAAYEALLDMLLAHQIRRAQKGKRLDRLIKPNQLAAVDHEILRMSMRVIKGFQEKLQAEFK